MTSKLTRFIISTDGEQLLKSDTLPPCKSPVSNPASFDGKTSTIDFCFLNYKRFLTRCRRGLSQVNGRAASDTRQSGNSAGYLPRLFDFQEQLTPNGCRESTRLTANRGLNKTEL